MLQSVIKPRQQIQKQDITDYRADVHTLAVLPFLKELRFWFWTELVIIRMIHFTVLLLILYLFFSFCSTFSLQMCGIQHCFIKNTPVIYIFSHLVFICMT